MTPILPAALMAALALAACKTETGGGAVPPPAQGGAALVDGTYDLRAEACGDPASETRLTLAGESWRFYEARCTRGAVGADGAVTLSCSSEGMTDTRAVSATMEGAALRLTDAGGTRLYQRCDG
ncbi:hypothetical protein CP157_00947 [Paracoccus marcusii]|uniref:hypothetical protein n=1 Tax=Paracoccus marcusii TaxID=59779 RepID=UPI001C3C6E83|nr:hypothetical protein [Paracoccus marcusii]QXI63236.1 hypothetical protein CP157_00947 [Paracoccus marcusii]